MNRNELTESTNTPSSLDELIKIAINNNWCAKLFCTTCGAIPFRKALGKIARDEVISGLRLLSHEFLVKHNGMFQLIVSETAYFPFGDDLLDVLEGSPAWSQLNAKIDELNCRYEKRMAYLASQTPEMLAQLRVERKAAKDQVTAPHRDRKKLSQQAISEAKALLDSMSDDQILTKVDNMNSAVSKRAIGGLVFRRLAECFRTRTIHSKELSILINLADTHSGHWKKLLNQVT